MRLTAVSWIVVSSLLHCCWAARQCRQVSQYQPIAPSDYDLSSTSFGDFSKNPLGYYSDYIPSIEDSEAPSPCVQIMAPEGFMVEVMMETVVAGAQLCGIDDSDEPIKFCDSGYVRYCDALLKTNPIYTFFCDDNSCETSEVTFYYRFYVQNTTELVQDPQDWCQERDASQFPSSLLRLPTNIPVPIRPNDRSEPNAGVKASSSLFVVLALLLALLLTLLYM